MIDWDRVLDNLIKMLTIVYLAFEIWSDIKDN